MRPPATEIPAVRILAIDDSQTLAAIALGTDSCELDFFAQALKRKQFYWPGVCTRADWDADAIAAARKVFRAILQTYRPFLEGPRKWTYRHLLLAPLCELAEHKNKKTFKWAPARGQVHERYGDLRLHVLQMSLEGIVGIAMPTIGRLESEILRQIEIVHAAAAETPSRHSMLPDEIRPQLLPREVVHPLAPAHSLAQIAPKPNVYTSNSDPTDDLLLRWQQFYADQEDAHRKLRLELYTTQKDPFKELIKSSRLYKATDEDGLVLAVETLCTTLSTEAGQLFDASSILPEISWITKTLGTELGSLAVTAKDADFKQRLTKLQEKFGDATNIARQTEDALRLVGRGRRDCAYVKPHSIFSDIFRTTILRVMKSTGSLENLTRHLPAVEFVVVPARRVFSRNDYQERDRVFPRTDKLRQDVQRFATAHAGSADEQRLVCELSGQLRPLIACCETAFPDVRRMNDLLSISRATFDICERADNRWGIAHNDEGAMGIPPGELDVQLLAPSRRRWNGLGKLRQFPPFVRLDHQGRPDWSEGLRERESKGKGKGNDNNARGSNSQPTNDNHNTNATEQQQKSKRVCIRFNEDRCNRDSNCKFAHTKVSAAELKKLKEDLEAYKKSKQQGA